MKNTIIGIGSVAVGLLVLGMVLTSVGLNKSEQVQASTETLAQYSRLMYWGVVVGAVGLIAFAVLVWWGSNRK